MDEAVNPHLAHAVLAAAALLAGGAQAQALADPTRPPANMIGAAPGGAGQPGATSEPQLQSVLIARQPGGRHIAVIDGQTVRLGETFKGALVARMSQTEVVLVRGGQRQVLKLFPAAAPDAGPAAHRQ
jgi:MSHA biogenesis protein MshK